MDKLEVARLHTRTSVLMIVEEMSPISTHLLVMAADEILRSIAKSRGLYLNLDMENLIKRDRLQEYRRIHRESYNWFKHADRDTLDVFSGPTPEKLSEINELQTFANLYSISQIDNCGLDVVGASFATYMMIFYEGMFDIERFRTQMPRVDLLFERFQRSTSEQMRSTMRGLFRLEMLLPLD